MGALAQLLLEPREYTTRSPHVVTGDLRLRRASSRLAALGGSYFSPTVAARGLASPYDELIAQAAVASAVDPQLIRAIISAESAWNPTACSTSSCGLMQINYQAHGLTRTQVLDPAFNVPYGTRVIAEQLARRPSVQLALAGYNAGTGRSDADLQARIDGNTLGVGTYVQTVLDYLTFFQSQSYGTGAPAPAPSAIAPDESVPAYDQGGSLADTVRQALAAMQPWQWWALGGAVGLAVVLVVVRRR